MSVLFIGGHDPVGGAGIQADLETAAAHHCRAYSLITCLTAQDSRNVKQLYPQNVGQFTEQAETLLADVTPDWVKIGLIGDVAIAKQIVRMLNELNKPVVLDPVLAAGGGHALASQTLLEIIVQELLPKVFLLTPNRAEARRLSGEQELVAATRKLLAQGCQQVLLTGADESEDAQVLNTLYFADQAPANFVWQKLPFSYHGSGCTLASACACQLSKGVKIDIAVQLAQAFTWQSLQQADKTGQSQHLPTRFVR